jgi:hypothetical protein
MSAVNAKDSSGPAALLFVIAGVLLLLLFAHPHAHVRTFADVMEFEIAHRLRNQIVHGGMIVLLGFILVAHLCAARLFRRPNLLVTSAITAFGGGCALMLASLVLDGFVTPALAVQSGAAGALAAKDSIETLVRFCDTSIRVLMPMALLAFAISALAWSGPLVAHGGRPRIAGILSGLIGVTIGALIFAVPPGGFNHALMAALFLTALWQLVLAFGFWTITARQEPEIPWPDK